ncbi:adenosylcobinamide amidohydrolase [Evansella halocellulosilytica]|uniref:adenosylcobinamide amidohydrolase n=1 Tax=Evansella halocellulosilytica TaxID=2011013 RepID=UPI000BB7199A|nr:adenosylcobinamide amidohydrolase [Evansella halocellulosilytica]
MLKVDHLTGGYGNRPIIDDLSFEINKGEFFSLLGPNGSGKTTLFNLITGRLPVKSGGIFISGQSLFSMPKIEKAKKVAVLTQEVHISFDYTVEEIVSLGRYPHQTGILKRLSRTDRDIIDRVMDATGVKKFRNSQFQMISGGEKQRVLLAKALAQEPEILLLDEPTNHLDIKHTFDILDLLKEWQHQKGLTIFAILHDLNVASLYADRIALLHEGTFLDVGNVDTLRKVDQLEKVYRVSVNAHSHPLVPKPQIMMTPNYMTRDGNRHQTLLENVCIEKNEKYIYLQFDEPLRTISNSFLGEGIQWLKHFINFHVENVDHNPASESDLEKWMADEGIPPEQASTMMTAVEMDDVVFVEKTVNNMNMFVVVTAGIGNARDISKEGIHRSISHIGTINTMVFIDAHFTDGALIHGYMTATEAKAKALQDLQIKDPHTNSIATGTSTDCLLLALTQKGERTCSAGSGSEVGEEIGAIVYEATVEAVKKYLKRIK